MESVVITKFEERSQPSPDQIATEKIDITANGTLRPEHFILGSSLKTQGFPSGVGEERSQGAVEQLRRIRTAEIKELEPNSGLLLLFLDQQVLEKLARLCNIVRLRQLPPGFQQRAIIGGN